MPFDRRVLFDAVHMHQWLLAHRHLRFSDSAVHACPWPRVHMKAIASAM
jgi:hypothetical protein